MTKQIISTEHAPAAIGPYSQGIGTERLLFTSGQLPIDPATGVMPQDVSQQARQSLKNVAAILEAAGSSLGKALKVTVYLARMSDFDTVNKVYQEFFTEDYPARSAFQVAALPKNALIEIEAVALR